MKEGVDAFYNGAYTMTRRVIVRDQVHSTGLLSGAVSRDCHDFSEGLSAV